jgi:cell division septation protein DedD
VAKSAPLAEPSPTVQTGSSAATPPADSYFVQIKSERDEKAAKEDLKAASDTYKSVLNTVPVLTKSADLGEKGIWFRLLAGPVRSRDEAAELCSKLKRAGLPACIVYKSE